MYNYKITGVDTLEDGKRSYIQDEVTGCLCRIDLCEVGCRAVISVIQYEGDSQYPMTLSTSKVMYIDGELDGERIDIETLNSVYHLERVN